MVASPLGRLGEAHRLSEVRSEVTAEGERLALLTQVCTALGDHEAGVRHGPSNSRAPALDPDNQEAKKALKSLRRRTGPRS